MVSGRGGDKEGYETSVLEVEGKAVKVLVTAVKALTVETVQLQEQDYQAPLQLMGQQEASSIMQEQEAQQPTAM